MNGSTLRSASASIPHRQVNTGLAVYATVCVLLVGLVLLTNWPTYSFEIRGGVIPLYYYVLPGLLVVPIVFAHTEIPLRLLKEPLVWWFAAYVVLGLLWQVLFQDFAEDAGRQFRLRLLMFFVFATVAVLTIESHRRLIALLVCACVLLSGAFSWFDSLRPYRFVPQGYEHSAEGRGAGLFLNPNIAGTFVVMGTIAALPYIPMRFRAAALTAAVVCLAPTFSRGAFVLIALTVVSAVFLRLLNRVQVVLALIAIPVLVAGVNFGYDYLMTHSEDRNMQRVVQRLAFFEAGAEDDYSIDERMDAAARAQDMFVQAPLLGGGLGKTTSMAFVTGPHNMYLMLMAEQGIFGLALYVGLVLVLWLRGFALARSAPTIEGREVGKAMIIFGVYAAANGFFSHNVLDEPQAMFLMAFLSAAGLQASRSAPWDLPAAHEARGTRPPPRRVRW